MDKVTKNLVEDFTKNFEIKSKKESDQFEQFCNFSIISKEYPESFVLEQISTGAGNDTGIDGLGILVNGKIVESKEEIDDLIETNSYLDVTFIFIQSKTSEHFDSKEISGFFLGIQDFFEDNPKLKRNESIEAKAELMNHIYKKSGLMTKDVPKCKIYYVTTGTWTNDQNLLAAFENGKKDLEEKKIFSQVIINPLGAKEIQKYYQGTKEAISRDVMFSNKIVMPEIAEVDEAYIGTIDFPEFRKLITDEEDNILSSIFYDNIRAFQGENPVNQKIRKTIEDKKFDKFVVFNNGITIVAKSIIPAGNKFTINDYQIVNGCQTSHVLYSMRNEDGMDHLKIPIRLIVSTDEDFVNDIITATNSQTSVKPEELEALAEFQKNLELYYQATKGDGQLYYERRSKQYNNNSAVIKTRIINIPTQIKCFASMFLKQPHKVSRYYGTIVKNLGENIFSKDHKPSAYYVCAYAYYKLDSLFRVGNLDPKYKKCRFHILMLLPGLISKEAVPPFNSRQMEKYSDSILKILLDSKKSLKLFKKAIGVIDSIGLDITDRDAFKTQNTVDLLLEKIK